MAGKWTARAKSAARSIETGLAVGGAAMVPRRTWIRSQHRGAQSFASARRVAVFVIFDVNGLVHDFVLAHLRALASAGFATIAVINSSKFGAEARARLEPVTALMIHRWNRGYDFGGYHDGLRVAPNLEDRDLVLLMNDSTYGPFFDLNETVFSKMDPSRAGMWALTDSWEMRYHLQTYFLCATGAALKSRAWKRFWDRFLHIDNKRLVIQRYEIGLTQHMIRHGVGCEAVFPYRQLAQSYADNFADMKDVDQHRFTPQQLTSIRHIYEAIRSGVPVNASHFMWDRLLLFHRSPYLKRELLTINPTGVPLAGYWERALRSVSDYDTTQIDRHLRAVVRGRSP
ncbi:polysaccharide biosynthesis-like protein [bacterium]|nr:polysaccharide biosynthesis-like protein [bacterium]